ncbi:MAG: 1-deoxy-D-xylulose-5-phosphate reductoisomerase [Lachnospiraceae bacterium]|nr:1-deoxy-D-xylulose-5-phosphate reductoisomerase [Lachnospiraceae bacterium]
MGRKLIILGSTGSIGTQTLDIVKDNESLSVVGLAAHSDVDLMEKQIRRFDVPYCVMFDEQAAGVLRDRLKDRNTQVASGMEGLLDLVAKDEADTVVTALVGMIGIRPTIAAIKAGKDIALANKETLVCAGHIIMPLATERHVKILPVDSEHSAIFQCLQGNANERIEKLLLTASGGPFRGKTKEALRTMTARDALRHPNWAMGDKVTIDSASLVNKGLEIMEAKWLFDVRLDQIQVVVQPQSIVHSAVQFVDGSIIAQLGEPDMHLPIQYALFYPDRVPLLQKRLNLFDLQVLTFEEPDTDTFEGLALAKEAAATGGTMPTVFNAANEIAVERFLKGEISFLEIYDLIKTAMRAHTVKENPDVDAILKAQQEVTETLNTTTTA